MGRPINYIDAPREFSQHLTTSGSPTGSFNQAIDNTGISTEFRIITPSDEILEVKSITLEIMNATGGIVNDGYMNLPSSGFAGGTRISGLVSRATLPSGTKIHLFGASDNVVILSDWKRFMNIEIFKEDASGPSVVLGQRDFDPPIYLDGSKGDIMKFVFFEYDFSGFLKHEMFLRGIRYSLKNEFLPNPIS